MPGMQELLVIMLVGLFVLGPERLPVVARAGARLLSRVRNYGVTASKELRGVVDLGGLGAIEQEVVELRRELDRTRADLRRSMRETMSSADPAPLRAPEPSEEVASSDAPVGPEAPDTPEAPGAHGVSHAPGAPDAPDAPDARG